MTVPITYGTHQSIPLITLEADEPVGVVRPCVLVVVVWVEVIALPGEEPVTFTVHNESTPMGHINPHLSHWQYQ